MQNVYRTTDGETFHDHHAAELHERDLEFRAKSNYNTAFIGVVEIRHDVQLHGFPKKKTAIALFLDKHEGAIKGYYSNRDSAEKYWHDKDVGANYANRSA